MYSQMLIFLLFILLSSIVIAVYALFYIASSEGITQKNPDRIRFVIFSFLLFLIIPYTLFTLPKAPYFLYSDSPPDKVFYVVAKQFAFAVSESPVTNEEEFSKAIGEGVKIKKDEVVEFRVTSFDVNHGLGIYDPRGRIVAQVQAMPGYMNRLRWKFKEPGIYAFQCLEYCGVAHAYMRINVEVLP